MKSRLLAAVLLSTPLLAQDDVAYLINGTKLDGIKVTSFDIRELKYTKGPSESSQPADQIERLELGKFKDVYRRGVANKDPDILLTVAQEQLKAKNALMAQAGLAAAGAMFFDVGKPQEAVAALEELQKALPEAGLVPEVYRQKFEYYMGLGTKGVNSAQQVAKKYLSDATGGAWPKGFALEAEFFAALAERNAGGTPAAFQTRLRALLGTAVGNPSIINRANVHLAHSLRENNDKDGARKIYEDLANKDGVDVNSRAGAFLGLGLLAFDAGGQDKEQFRAALLQFLRVRLETHDCWPVLQAESLYWASKAAEKWRGTDYAYIVARCRGELFNDFPDSEWTQRAKAGN